LQENRARRFCTEVFKGAKHLQDKNKTLLRIATSRNDTIDLIKNEASTANAA
jgi:hypothetical protein